MMLESTPAVPNKQQRKAVLAAGIGNVMEWYDWGVYGFFAPIFAIHFFPASDPIVALLLTLATFAIGFFMRPIGGAILGPFGDRAGRRNAMAVQILIMAVASLVISALPGYHTIGLLAPILLLLARLAQGFSTGGEFGASSAFLVEYAPKRRRGLIGSLQQVSVGLGTLCASAVASLVMTSLGHNALYNWGWRIPFWIGAVVGFFGLYLRLSVNETPAFTKVELEQKVSSRPLWDAIYKHPRDFMRVFGITIAGTLTYYMWVLFLPTYVANTTNMSLSSVTLVNTICLVIFIGVIPLSAALSDKIGRRPLLLMFAGGFLMLSYPLFLWLKSGSLTVFFFVEMIGLLLITGYSGTTATVMAEQFTTEVRNTGIAVPYALAVAIFGGTAPFISTYLISIKEVNIMPLYLMASAVVSGLFYFFMKETHKKELE